MIVRRCALKLLISVLIACMAEAAPSLAEGSIDVPVRLHNHRFLPAVINVPPGKEIRLIVTNADKTPEEFRSKSLKIEREIGGGKRAVIKIGPQKEGARHRFVGQYHPATAQFELVVK
jgi:hypothetical protein